MVIEDWDQAVKQYQDQIDECEDENQIIFAMAKAFGSRLQTHFLKCLFSYAFFFISLEGAYDSFYSQLNQINKKPFLRVKHDKSPKRSEYIEKVRMIRNMSIAHIGTSRGDEADLSAAIMWQPLSLSKSAEESWDLNKMCFGGGRLQFKDIEGNVISESSDMEIEGIHKLNAECMSFLKQYDDLCFKYLKQIHQKLPMTDGSEHYYEFKK